MSKNCVKIVVKWLFAKSCYLKWFFMMGACHSLLFDVIVKMSGCWASMWLSYEQFMFSIWSKTNLKNQNTAELSVLAEWSKTPISQIQREYSLMFECFIRSFRFYISKFKEKACNRLKCFIQPELMLFCFSYYSSQIGTTSLDRLTLDRIPFNHGRLWLD